MIKSMTGFGQSVDLINNMKCTIEIKSVNNRYRDISVRSPRSISYIDEVIKSKISEKISRGKVEVFVTLDNFSDDCNVVSINKKLANLYIEAIRDLIKEYSLKDEIRISDLLNLGEVLEVTKNDINQELVKEIVTNVLDKALEKLIDMRITEGENLANDIIKKVANIKNLIDIIKMRSKNFAFEYKSKLRGKIKELLDEGVKLDEGRLELEVAIIADKCGIDEELVRLMSHCDQFISTVNNEGQPVGRKLDFLIQEMNRETNTIGSKVSDLDTIKFVVEIKSELEKIREQVQNIE